MPDTAQRALFDVREIPVAVVPDPDPVPVRLATERQMLDALHQRYSAVLGNGRRYVVAEHVRSHASFDARRTADFVALDTWKSGRFDLAGHEVKVSRSDWLRELKDPAKAAEFTPYMNRWWVVVPDARLVKAGELPTGWGLLALAGDRLRQVTQAQRRAAEPMPPTRLVALMRAVQATATSQASRASCREGYPVTERTSP